MRTIYLYILLFFYLVGSIFKRLKIKRLKKKGCIEEAKSYTFRMVSRWAQFVTKKVGLEIETIGLQNIPKGTCLFVGNHQSNLDVPCLLAVVPKPLGFIAKIEMKNIPIIGFWMKEINCIFMDRDNVREAVKSINEGVESLKNGNSLVIFPEGTRSRGGEVKEFKKGSLKLGTKAGVPIVPVCISGTYRSLEGNNGKIKKGKAKIVFGEAIYPEKLNKEELNVLHETIRETIIKNM